MASGTPPSRISRSCHGVLVGFSLASDEIEVVKLHDCLRCEELEGSRLLLHDSREREEDGGIAFESAKLHESFKCQKLARKNVLDRFFVEIDHLSIGHFQVRVAHDAHDLFGREARVFVHDSSPGIVRSKGADPNATSGERLEQRHWGEAAIAWNQDGPQGPTGPAGPAGPQGLSAA
jgi:hypothetical protein